MRVCFAWFCFLFVILPMNGFAEDTDLTSANPDIVIVYTGDGRLKIDPAGCCSKIGGMSRRATRIAEIREQYPHVLVLDCGNYLKARRNDRLDEVRPKHVQRALKVIGYDALNVAVGELDAGELFLSLFGSEPSIPLVSANAKIADKSDVHQWPSFLIRTLGGIRIGIIGLASNADTPTFTVTDPILAINNILPELETKADIIVLLSNLNWNLTKSIVMDNPSINLAIVGYDNYATFDPETVGETLMVKSTFDGGTLGIVKIWTTAQRNISHFKKQIELLETKIRPRPEYQFLEEDYQADVIAWKKKVKEEEKNKKFNKYLRMSPKEFMDYMKNNNGRLE